MKDSVLLSFLYDTVPGRLLLRPLIGRQVSDLAGRLLSSKASALFIPWFIRKHNISMKGIAIPEKGFSSFNDFFTRKKTKAPSVPGEEYLMSPCDGFLTVLDITDDQVFHVKGCRFTLEALLQDRELAESFKGGRALIFRLTPAHYHRYCYPAAGEISCDRRIEGKYHCVRPIALRRFPVFIENTREYQVIRTDRVKDILQMEVGAMLVGRISNKRRPPSDNRVEAGEEKGCFAFGGSTIILLLQKDAVYLKKDLLNGGKDEEIPVKAGSIIARARSV
jgi:phosphatidylserine decarboxylase